MDIGIEASRANRPVKTGVEWYAYHLIQAIKELPEAQSSTWKLYANEALRDGLEVLPPNWQEVRLPWPPRYLWTQGRLSLEMLQRPPKTLFVPAHVLPRVIPRKTVVTVHDVGFYRYPKFYKPIQNVYHRWSTRDIVKRASAIITVSEYSRQELLHFCKVDPEKVHVTHLGLNEKAYRKLPAEEAQVSLKRFRMTSPFFLYVGRLEAKKNVLLLIEAFHRYKTDHGLGDPYQLVLAGAAGAHYDDIAEAIARSSVRDQIHVTGYLTETEKRGFLSLATALVHPSWYEGFGFTPLEAMSASCPVLCSRAGSLPEIVGLENALWFDPFDAESLTNALTKIVQDDELCATLRARGREWVYRYSWKKTAQETLQILTDVSSVR